MKTHKTNMKLVCLGREPRARGSLGPQIPQNPTFISLEARARLPKGLSTGSKMRAGPTPPASHGAPGLGSRGGRPLPSPRPLAEGVEAGSRSFVFVSRKDSDYRSALRACSPGNRAHATGTS